jgi:hypothetical protein
MWTAPEVILAMSILLFFISVLFFIHNHYKAGETNSGHTTKNNPPKNNLAKVGVISTVIRIILDHF